MSAITADRLRRSFGDVVALEDVSFEIPSGGVTALLGPNGAGKTTAFEILEGYLPPTTGRVSVLGADPWRAARSWRARIGVVLQSTSLDRELTVRDALAVFAPLFPDPRPVSEVLSLIGLESEAGARIGRLSGGQQRRVDLGLGIIGRPELLFLDEPTTGLDPAARRACWTTITALAAAGTTVLLSTHYMEEAEELADHLLVLVRGRLVADATPERLRGLSARSRIALPIPPDIALPDLPSILSAAPPSERVELIVDSATLRPALEQLLAWAAANGLDLGGLRVGPPSLEDAYLELMTSTPHAGMLSHV